MLLRAAMASGVSGCASADAANAAGRDLIGGGGGGKDALAGAVGDEAGRSGCHLGDDERGGGGGGGGSGGGGGDCCCCDADADTAETNGIISGSAAAATSSGVTDGPIHAAPLPECR